MSLNIFPKETFLTMNFSLKSLAIIVLFASVLASTFVTNRNLVESRQRLADSKREVLKLKERLRELHVEEENLVSLMFYEAIEDFGSRWFLHIPEERFLCVSTRGDDRILDSSSFKILACEDDSPAVIDIELVKLDSESPCMRITCNGSKVAEHQLSGFSLSDCQSMQKLFDHRTHILNSDDNFCVFDVKFYPKGQRLFNSSTVSNTVSVWVSERARKRWGPHTKRTGK